MDEQELRRLLGAVKAGRTSRRAFVRKMAGFGLTAPFAGMLLSHAGVAQSGAKADYKPTKPGGGALKTLFWQAPTLLNPHFAVGNKDQEGSRVFYEPLAGWDAEGNLVPVLAAEIPEIENGGIAPDGMSVTWRLKKGVQWHDGQPFTADDIVFNWEYAADPATAATTIGNYQDIEQVEKLDPLTVRVRFKRPMPFWAQAFVGSGGMIIPKHLFGAYKGAASRDVPTNLKPVGTGPYRFVDFKPGDLVKGERNPAYHVPNRPYFDMIELKGGGDAVSAARAVIQTGEYDYAWNLQVEDEILLRLEAGGTAKGRVEIVPGGSIEHVGLNFTDPWTEVDGERSSAKTTHPLFSDPAVRQALRLLIDRASVEKHIYGRTGIATGNFLNNPKRFASANTHWEFNIEKANQLLEQVGWKRSSDGIRAKDGKQLRLVFQTSTNAPRQKTQAIIKQACQKAGIDVELKSVTASVYFSSDVANPDTSRKFYADIQIYNTNMGSPDPEGFMRQFLSWEIASKENKWQGRNITRWRSEEYDNTFHAAENELDPAKRAALFIKMNDLAVSEPAVIPVVYRPGTSGLSHSLRARLSGWDNAFWNLRDWYRET